MGTFIVTLISVLIVGIVLIVFASKIGKLLGKLGTWLGSKLIVWIFRIVGIFLICLAIIMFLIIPFVYFIPGDYFFELHGTVYEWVDAPSNETTKIIFNNKLPEDIDVKPIEEASINLYWMSPEEGERKNGSSTFCTFYTDKSGNFNSHDADPSQGAGNYHIIVMKEGFIDASEFLLYEEGPVYQMIVLMVRKDS